MNLEGEFRELAIYGKPRVGLNYEMEAYARPFF